MRVIMLGLRGFPDVQGGVETHAENLCPLLSSMGCEVEVIVRSSFVPMKQGNEWQGVRYIRVWAPRSKVFEAIVHSLLGVVVAAWRRPDVLHIQAIGPSIVTPIARLLGLRVVVTHHGPDYDREKWGPIGKLVLRVGEALGMRFANRRIAISRTIRDLIRNKYGLDADLIANGVKMPRLPSTKESLERFHLEPKRYVLSVGRIVPEKRHVDLISAFVAANLRDWKLVIVGAADHPDSYSADFHALVERSESIVATGFQNGQALAELYANAGFFVLPSSHEGLPIVLLEALSYGLPAVASAIRPNLEIGVDSINYFPVGGLKELQDRLQQFARATISDIDRERQRAFIARHYNWNNVATQTLSVYQAACRGTELKPSTSVALAKSEMTIPRD